MMRIFSLCAALTLLGCGGSWPPPGYLTPTPRATATEGPGKPTETPTLTPVPVPATPTPSPRPDPPTVTPTPILSAGIPPGGLEPLTMGRAVLELDLSSFVLEPGLDTYAFLTACWADPHAPVIKRNRPETPCVQLAVRNNAAGELFIEVRYSANIRYDGTTTDEKIMCGEGTRSNRWIKLPPGAKHRLTLEWQQGFVQVASAVDSAVLTQGAVNGKPKGSSAAPGFGWWCEGIPEKGIGWSWQERWTLQAHGGSVKLLTWESTGPLTDLGHCPGP